MPNATSALQDLLDSVLGRLTALEAKVGVTSSEVTKPSGATAPTEAPAQQDSPAVLAYDEYLEKNVVPLSKACDDIGELKNLGALIKDAWGGIRIVLVLASAAKKPANPAQDLQPSLKPIQTALESIRKLRLDRKYDWHVKSILEMAGCLSWILIMPPPQTPSAFCKEAIASSTFWSNKIRKEYKGKDENHIAFCDSLKSVGNELMEYIGQNHKAGLTWNPQGVPLEDAIANTSTDASAPAKPKVATKPVSSGGGGGVSGLMAELQKKQTSDGSSAATGLRKVTKDQQTWRKEFKGEKSSTVSAVTSSVAPKKTIPTAVKKGPPKCEFQDRGHKWIVENQTKETAGKGGLSIDITDPKQQVYVYNCENVTIQIKGDKVKSITLDKCKRLAVVFPSCISSCEVVNCQRMQLQTTGVCPTFSIDKTVGCLVYLSKGSVDQSSFVASQSSEMNVSYPDENGEQKEVPIPEQFVHKLKEGSITSEVSDLYH